MNRRILITGASKGIGLATAQSLSAAGWAVIGVARAAPVSFPGEFIVADLSDEGATQALGEQLALRGDVVGIINNIGLAAHETFGEVTWAGFGKVLDLNLRPALVLTEALLPAMRAASFGRIVNITSLVTRGLPWRTSYAAAKAALESLTRTMAVELAGTGITANAVAPGPVETELFRTNNALGSEGEARYLKLIPMGRLGQPDEIAAAIVFLASEQAGFMTGQTLFVDGGASLSARA